MKGYITNVQISDDKINIIFSINIKKDDGTLYKTVNYIIPTKDYSIEKVGEIVNQLLQSAIIEESITSIFIKTKEEILAELPAEYSI